MLLPRTGSFSRVRFEMRKRLVKGGWRGGSQRREGHADDFIGKRTTATKERERAKQTDGVKRNANDLHHYSNQFRTEIFSRIGLVLDS